VNGVFVPPTGRAFGDVQRALNATERLVILQEDPFEMRDYGVILSHVGRPKEAYEALQYYVRHAPEILPGGVTQIVGGDGHTSSEREEEVLQILMHKLEVEIAEASFKAPDAEKPSTSE